MIVVQTPLQVSAEDLRSAGQIPRLQLRGTDHRSPREFTPAAGVGDAHKDHNSREGSEPRREGIDRRDRSRRAVARDHHRRERRGREGGGAAHSRADRGER